MFEGPSRAVRAAVEFVREGPPLADVESIEVDEEAPTQADVSGKGSFRIR
jgi:acylphosphatase